eukprot:5308527-Pyramimonas_sp.AAC.1
MSQVVDEMEALLSDVELFISQSDLMAKFSMIAPYLGPNADFALSLVPMVGTSLSTAKMAVGLIRGLPVDIKNKIAVSKRPPHRR